MKIEDDSIDYYQALFGKHKDYWTTEAVRLEMEDRTRFNIFALIFGLFWFLYRKMYRESLVILIIIVAITYLEEVMLANDYLSAESRFDISLSINFGVSIVLGLIANRLYLNHCARKVADIQEAALSEEQKLAALEARGGTNILLPAILFLSFTILNYMILS